MVLVDLNDGAPVLPTTFERKRPINVTLDSGDPLSVVLAERYNNPKYADYRFEGYPNLGGIGGTSSEVSSCGHAMSMEFGPIVYGNVPICFDKAMHEDGYVGFDFLKHFNWTFDYQQGRIFLTPTK